MIKKNYSVISKWLRVIQQWKAPFIPKTALHHHDRGGLTDNDERKGKVFSSSWLCL